MSVTIRSVIPLALVIAGGILASCAHHRPSLGLDEQGPQLPWKVGILLMAHGGDVSWNKAVLDAVEPVRRSYPVEVAFGMAHPESLQNAVNRLEGKKVRKVAVVRLFLSGDSFRGRTEQILGLRPGAPPWHERRTIESSGNGGDDPMELWRIETRSTFVLSDGGLLESDLTADILVDRARELSRDPPNESVLILAHGARDGEENDRWLAHMEAFAQSLRETLPFRAVKVETLREDWPEERAQAEEDIRSFIDGANHGGGRAIVIPLRVFGFGPYASVLSGLDYVADGRGLLPDPRVTDWIVERAVACFSRGGWEIPSDSREAAAELP